MMKPLIPSFSKWVKKHYKELIALLLLTALALSMQLIGCQDAPIFALVDPVEQCQDFDTLGFENGECTIDDLVCNDSSCIPRTDSDDEVDDSFFKNNERADDDFFENNEGENRGVLQNQKSFAYKYYVQLGKVDIIFAVDNSSSMEIEHKNIANQFENFLTDIKDLNYRIAITTVDISSSPGNKSREYQDGEFIEFDDGNYYLYNIDGPDGGMGRVERNKRHKDNIKSFKKAIKRPETVYCKADEDACPDDERAICALNMALDANQNHDFFRPDSLLMVIIISDEDERSSSSFVKTQRQIYEAIDEDDDDREDENYEYEDCDYPDVFYQKVMQRFTPIKRFSAHAIIIVPGDESCFREQQIDGGRGYYGELYEQFVNPPRELSRSSEMMENIIKNNYREGTVSSICDRNYDNQLGNLARYLVRPDPITLICEPIHIDIRTGKDRMSEGKDYNVKGRKVHISKRIPFSTKLKVNYSCPYSSE